MARLAKHRYPAPMQVDPIPDSRQRYRPCSGELLAVPGQPGEFTLVTDGSLLPWAILATVLGPVGGCALNGWDREESNPVSGPIAAWVVVPDGPAWVWQATM